MVRGREGYVALCRSLVVFLLLGLVTALLGCAPAIVGERNLVPDPLWAQSGKEVREGTLIASSEQSRVEVKYLAKDELLEFLNRHSKDPALFDAAPSWLEAITAFLIEISNSSDAPMVFQGRHAVLQDDKGSELSSLGFSELYLALSEDPTRDKKMRVLEGLLLSSSPLLSGESRQGLLLFGAPDPKAGKVALGISFLFADKALKTQGHMFPFAIEALPPESVEGASGGKGVER